MSISYYLLLEIRCIDDSSGLEYHSCLFRDDGFFSRAKGFEGSSVGVVSSSVTIDVQQSCLRERGIIPIFVFFFVLLVVLMGLHMAP